MSGSKRDTLARMVTGALGERYAPGVPEGAEVAGDRALAWAVGLAVAEATPGAHSQSDDLAVPPPSGPAPSPMRHHLEQSIRDVLRRIDDQCPEIASGEHDAPAERLGAVLSQTVSDLIERARAGRHAKRYRARLDEIAMILPVSGPGARARGTTADRVRAVVDALAAASGPHTLTAEHKAMLDGRILLRRAIADFVGGADAESGPVPRSDVGLATALREVQVVPLATQRRVLAARDDLRAAALAYMGGPNREHSRRTDAEVAADLRGTRAIPTSAHYLTVADLEALRRAVLDALGLTSGGDMSARELADRLRERYAAPVADVGRKVSITAVSASQDTPVAYPDKLGEVWSQAQRTVAAVEAAMDARRGAEIAPGGPAAMGQAADPDHWTNAQSIYGAPPQAALADTAAMMHTMTRGQAIRSVERFLNLLYVAAGRPERSVSGAVGVGEGPYVGQWVETEAQWRALPFGTVVGEGVTAPGVEPQVAVAGATPPSLGEGRWTVPGWSNRTDAHMAMLKRRFSVLALPQQWPGSAG